MDLSKELNLGLAFKAAFAPRKFWSRLTKAYPWKAMFQLYILPLFLLVNIISFIRSSLIGHWAPYSTIKLKYSISNGIIAALLQYGTQLLILFIFAHFLARLCRKLDYSVNLDHTVTLVGFSCSAPALAAVLLLIPLGSLIVLIAGVIGLAAFYYGLKNFLKIEQQDQLLIFASGIFGAILIAFIVGWVVMHFMPAAGIVVA